MAARETGVDCVGSRSVLVLHGSYLSSGSVLEEQRFSLPACPQCVTDRNYVAQHNLGNYFLDVPGRLPDAIAQLEAALGRDPDSPIPHNDLGNALARIPGRLPQAISEYEAALRIKPDYAEAHNNLGSAPGEDRPAG